MARKRKFVIPTAARNKVHKVMGEFKRGTLRTGSKRGPRVTSRSQAMAIGLSEARKAGARIPKLRSTGRRAAVRR